MFSPLLFSQLLLLLSSFRDGLEQFMHFFFHLRKCKKKQKIETAFFDKKIICSVAVVVYLSVILQAAVRDQLLLLFDT